MRIKSHLRANKVIVPLVGVLLYTVSLLNGYNPDDISGTNTSIYLGNGRWAYTVFIKTSPTILERIDYVEYKLDPDSSHLVRRISELGDSFHPYSVSDTGRAVFEIDIKVNFKKGRAQYLTHRLRFESMSIDEPLPIRANNTARMIKEGWWEWKIFIQAPEDVLEQVQCVEYTLHPTFPDPVEEVCEPGNSPDAFTLQGRGWGTFEIQIQVFLKDGRVQKLKHYLKF